MLNLNKAMEEWKKFQKIMIQWMRNTLELQKIQIEQMKKQNLLLENLINLINLKKEEDLKE